MKRERLVEVVKDPATARQVLTMEADRQQPAGDCLSRGGERLLALALAEVQLRRGLHSHLDYAVGQLAWQHLVEPDPIERRVLHSNHVENALPDVGIHWMRSM